MAQRREFSSVDDLRDSRRRYVTEARENGFEDGLRTLLADLYPDNAHFIYELLQNAEDAGAASVDFDLQPERLVVSHDGSRHFTLDDVVAITGIGDSAKKDDPTSIGKFGVGFKAVFAYTDHPQVHSGDYAFAIEELFIPEAVSHRHSVGKTVFVFPFDRDQKPAEVAYTEVARGLRELGGSTVLFLTGIRTISYRLADGETGHVDRDEVDSPRITITEVKGKDVQTSMWLRLVGQPKEMSSHLTVAAAFSLHDASAKTDKSKAAARLRVQALDVGETCIYFPATKETSGLRFHIHAPFASTVARDSVRDTDDNRNLVRAIGELVVDSLPGLRDAGLLDDGMLSALPNVDDPLEAPYDIIRELIYEAFTNKPLTPVFGGGEFAPASQLVSSPSEFRPGLEPSDLSTILSLIDRASEPVPKWVAPRGGKAGQFLKGLDITPFAWTELSEALENVEFEFLNGVSHAEGDDLRALTTWRSWLASKSDEQIRSFYELLGHGVLEDEFPYWFDLPVIRVMDGSTINHVRGKGVYLPTSSDDTGPDRIPVDLAYFEDEAPSKSLNSLKALYSASGVEKWDDRAIVKQRIGAYRAEDWPEWPEHVHDLRFFIARVEAHPSDLLLFRGVAVLRGEDENGDSFWSYGSDLVIDAPYESTGLASLQTERCRLSSEYHDVVPGISEFARKLGAVSRLKLEMQHPLGNKQFENAWRWGGRETQKGVKQDWDLPDFDAILTARDPALLMALWILACEQPAIRAHGQYQANGRSPVHRFTSRIGQRMVNTEWILDHYGVLRSPKSMTVDELPDEWPSPPPGSLAAAVRFGAEAQAEDIAKADRRVKAQSLGFSLEFVEMWAELDEDAKREVLPSLLKQLEERAEFPQSAAADPERRGRLVGEDASDAPEHRTEVRERSVTVGPVAETKARADQYLREQYTSDDRSYCQACHQPSEFKVNDRWYFEKVEFLPGRKYMHHQNHLALCPLCAAKYKHVRLPDDEGLLANLFDLPVPAGSGTVALPIALNGARVELKFTGKHAVDLKAVLTVAGELRSGAVAPG